MTESRRESSAPTLRLRPVEAPDGRVDDQGEARDAYSRAWGRVTVYLQSLGVTDPRQIQELTSVVLADLRGQGLVDEELVAGAVEEARRRVEAWLRKITAQAEAGLDDDARRIALQLSLQRHPEAFLDEDPSDGFLQALEARGGPVPVERERLSMRPQELLRVRSWPTIALTIPVVAATACGTSLFARSASWGGDASPRIVVLSALFALLFGWVAFGFWKATIGVVVRLLSRALGRALDLRPAQEALPRTAVAMPVFNEDPARVFASIRAMHESLANTVHARSFDLFVLSDTRAPQIWAEEERLFAEALRDHAAGSRIYYRRRERNTRRKSGNIAEFLERWGSQYTYLALVDADSVLAGYTLVEAVERMERSPRLGILQLPSELVGSRTLFGRLLQFAAGVYGPVFWTGQRVWEGSEGNYYGHNAVIRVEPFIRHCGLPALPGEPPLGGEILSHDFVEAALMRRAGWEVQLADDMDGSYEEVPPTLADFAARDRRWCQGNLQHLRLLTVQGLGLVSRMHFLIGAFSYLASPLLLAFVVLGAWDGVERVQAGLPPPGPEAGLLLAATAALLLGPRLYSLILLAADPPRLAAHGGLARTVASLALEIALSSLMAPVLALAHTRHVLEVALGGAVGWAPQRRDAGGADWRRSVGPYVGPSLIGVAASALLVLVAPQVALWVSPVLAGLVLAIPVALLTGSERAGQVARALGLLLIADETSPRRVLQRRDDLHRALRATPPEPSPAPAP